jgi:cell division septation protein DedD
MKSYALPRLIQAIALAGMVAGALAGVSISTLAYAQANGGANSVSSASASAQPSQPAWKDLSAAQQTALAPLSAQWPTISAERKIKWLEVSKNYANLPAPEQAKLHSRMADWAALSPQQRASARYNFSQNQALTSGLTAEQRSAQWQAYQLLSPEEKSKLAASSAKPAAGPAVALRPADPLRSSPPPKFGTAKALAQQSEPAKAPVTKISIAPHLQKGNSLMPQKSTVSIATPSGTQAPQ